MKKTDENFVDVVNVDIKRLVLACFATFLAVTLCCLTVVRFITKTEVFNK